MMRKYVKIALVTSILFSPVNVFARNVDHNTEVNVKTSIEKALAYSPFLQNKLASKQKAEHLIRDAKGAYFPQLNMWARGGVSQETSYDSRKNDSFDNSVGIGELGVNANIMLWDAGATSSAVKAQEAKHTASIYDVIDGANTLALSTLNAHIDILRYQKLVRLAQNNVKEHQYILNVLYKRFNEGLSTQGDVDQLIGRVRQAEAALLGYEEALYKAEINYIRLTGDRAPSKLALVSEPKNNFINEKNVLDLSEKNNTYLKYLSAQVESLENTKKSLNSTLAPKFSFDTGPSYSNKDTSGDKDIFSWNAMVNMKWNLYDGGSTRARVRSSKSDILSARKSLLDAKDAINEQIKITYKRTSVAQKQAILYEKAAKAAKAARKNFFYQFEAGKKDLLSILDAETASYTASVESVIAKNDSLLGQYRLHALAGTLLDEIGIDIDTLADAEPREGVK